MNALNDGYDSNDDIAFVFRDDDLESAQSVCEEDPVCMNDDVTAQLAASGPVGVAAAAAIVSTKRGKKRHTFETNPFTRKRQRNRLLRKLRQTIDEYAARVGQQAIILTVTPESTKSVRNYKVFGTKPLENVIRNLKGMVMEELENVLTDQAPPPAEHDPALFELPPLIIDGIPTSVGKMTQAQLRAFIPLMLKYSTGRGKPGWGRESTRPPWWPKQLPWANVRSDVRTEDEKHNTGWTYALRQIVFNCYKFHDREDLLGAFTDENEKANATVTAKTETQCTSTVLHTISNSDGTVSIVQVDPNNPIITLPDGTTIQVQGMAAIQTNENDGIPIHTIQATSNNAQDEVIHLDSVTEAMINSEGQLILTGDGKVNGMIAVPADPSMYHTMVANIQYLHTNSDGTVYITSGGPLPKELNNGDNSATHSLMIQGSGSEGPQVLQVFSLKDADALSKAMQGLADVKTEETVLSDL